MSMHHWTWLWSLALVGFLGACEQKNTDFALPEGNIEKGKQTFVEFRCNDCHAIADIAHTGSEVATEVLGKPTQGKLLIRLGGKTPRFRSQAELVTAVVNPTHKISTSYSRHLTTSQSPMRSYNDVMTVQNLIDLVAFLQAEYDVTPPRLIYHDYREGPHIPTE